MYQNQVPRLIGKFQIAYFKVLDIIQSCKTENHIKGAINTVENFKTLYKQVGYPKVLSYSLDRELNKKYFRVTKQYPLK